jgi:hypothetical protein
MILTAYALMQLEIVKLAQLGFSKEIKPALLLVHYARHIIFQLDFVFLVIRVTIFSMEPAQLD